MANASQVISGNIGKESVALSQNWGASFHDYSLTDGNGNVKKVDFQDIMVSVSQYRAISVEDEVTPLTRRIKDRNAYLDKLGASLAEMTKIQSSFSSEAKGSDTSGDVLSDSTYAVLAKMGITKYVNGNRKVTKANTEAIIQEIKSKIDGLNNRAQADMTRLQGLVDRRDESYSTASSLMTAVSDTRSTTIRNM